FWSTSIGTGAVCGMVSTYGKSLYFEVRWKTSVVSSGVSTPVRPRWSAALSLYGPGYLPSVRTAEKYSGPAGLTVSIAYERSIAYLTSLEVMSSPLENFRPERIFTVQVRPSEEAVGAEAARPGT